MQPERTPQPKPQEQRDYAGIAQDLRERLQSGVLSELTPYPQFVVWKYVVENNKLKKRPYQPKTHVPAKTNDPSTWTDVTTALKALGTGRYNGIGFVFAEADPFIGTDLDACVGKDGSIAAWAEDIITSLSSYTEYSPSKLGVHILTRATLQGAGRKTGNVEMYATERYFTLTTDHVPGTPTIIEERQQQQSNLYTSLAPQVPPIRSTENTRGSGVAQALALPAPSRSDEEVVDKARSARNGASFAALWQGNISGYKSKSEADFTLVLRLLYWTHDDIAQTKRLFQQSGLYDPEKTDRLTGKHSYLDVTIYNAMKKRGNPPMRR
jgi:putative DNA primase/helicase